MFKLESYITPIILSQVERYVKNIKAEDSQVSLWGGDAVFNNLDLRLDVLEQELHLPFSLVSGHIHELQIHVPWTRLNAEPIVLTINTIECVLKLPSDKASSGRKNVNNNYVKELEYFVSESSEDTTGGTSVPGDDKTEEKKKGKRRKEEQTAPPGYIQGLINKIISNISVVCNNLILKYVEDDLVLSLNVRNVSYVSCDSSWQPAFTEFSLADLIRRKLLSVSDLTICLDRRGTTGKIEVYQDPLLYRCSMAVRLSWCYASLSSKLPFRTVINLLADKMDFSMTGVQVPMVVRLFKLFLAFYYGDILSKQEQARRKSKHVVVEGEELDPALAEDPDASLGSLLWDVGSSIGTALLPVYWEDEENPEEGSSERTNSSSSSSCLGVYCREATLTLKAAASVKAKGFYRGGKQCFNSYLVCTLQGILCEVNTKANNWVNVQAGISHLLVSPVGQPSDLVETYIKAGREDTTYLTNSLFAPDFGSEEETPRELLDLAEADWDSHLAAVTETVLVERTGALGLDYVYHVELPSDLNSDTMSELSADLEQSNLPERALCRVVLGPARLTVSQAGVSRVRTVVELVQDYDYVPYVEARPEPGPDNLGLPTREEVESLENNNPVRVYRLTLLQPSVTVVGKLSSLELGLSSLSLVHQTPMYPLRNVRTGCLMHPPTKTILANCHSTNNIHLQDAWIKLNVEAGTPTSSVLTVDRAGLSQKTLLYPQFWKNIYQKHSELEVKVETSQLDISVPQAGLVSHLLDSVLGLGLGLEFPDLLAQCRDSDQPVLTAVLSNLTCGLTQTAELDTSTLALDSVSVSLRAPAQDRPVPIFNGLCQKSNRNIIISNYGLSPGKALPDESSSKWLIFGLQWPRVPLRHETPTMIRVSLGETFLLCEPKLSQVVKVATVYASQRKASPRAPDNNRSIRSEDRGVRPKPESGDPLEEISFFQCLSGTVVDMKVGSVCLYFTDKSLSGVSGQNVREVVMRAARAKREYNVINVQLTSGDVHNAACKVSLSQYNQFPVLFPPAVWSSGKDNFPWIISLSGFYIGRMNETNFTEILKPVNTNCTFGSSRSESGRNLAVHVDMSPVEFVLDSLVMSTIAMVVQSLLTLALDSLPEVTEQESRLRIGPGLSGGSALVMRSVGSVSESTTQVTGSLTSGATARVETSQQDWSLWLQWAVPQTSWTLLSGREGEQAKLVFLLEDSTISVDQQSAYTKIKMRVRSVTGRARYRTSALILIIFLFSRSTSGPESGGIPAEIIPGTNHLQSAGSPQDSVCLQPGDRSSGDSLGRRGRSQSVQGSFQHDHN